MLNLASAVAFCLLAYTLTVQKWVLCAEGRGGGRSFFAKSRMKDWMGGDGRRRNQKKKKKKGRNNLSQWVEEEKESDGVFQGSKSGRG